MFLLHFINFFLLNSNVLAASNTFVFSGGPNTYLAFDSWRPCLTGYVRFDIRTNAQDGTLAYIDDRGKFDFFYLKLIQGKLRLLFNLGNDRQALNVNMKINDDQWHTILIRRNGQITSLNIDHGLAENFTITHSEDLFFGGAISNEYEASPFYFGGIPSILERPSSGNLSSFDVYMQPRFRGQLRNIIYKNCTDSRLIQPNEIEIPSGISLIPNSYCSQHICGIGICLITEKNFKCLCDETDYQGENCQYQRRERNELTFDGKQYSKYHLRNFISSMNEILTFEFRSNHYDGLLFQLIDSQFYIKLKQGQLIVEYRVNHSWYELPTMKERNLIDNQWHYVQIQRNDGQIIILIDQYYFQFENEMKFSQLWNFTEIFLGGNEDFNIRKFSGCLKDISIIFNENFTIHFNSSLTNLQEYGFHRHRTCKSLINPIQFLISSSFISFALRNFSQQFNFSFRFETFSSDCILLYSQSNQDFLGLDLIDGFVYLTININRKKQRQELFQQRFNDGQSHYFQLELRNYQEGLELNVTMDYRQNTRILIRNPPSQINSAGSNRPVLEEGLNPVLFTLHTLTIGGVNPAMRWLPTNYYSGIMHHGLIGCFSDLEINNELINLTKYISTTNNNNHISPKSGPCSTTLSTKRECLCEHDGECRINNGGIWSCDCSKTGYTGRRCEQIAYHLDLNQIQTFEFNTYIQWSEQINNIAFGLQAVHDEENFLQIRSCRLSSKCDSIHFSIRNGLLHINFYLLNLTIEYPFLLDNQWHLIDLQRIKTNFLLHIDNHIIQQRVNINSFNSSSIATIWIVFYGNKQIWIEDLRLYDQSIYSKFLNDKSEQIQLKTRAWKPLNAISFDTQQNSYIEIQLNEILCQDCQLNAFYFQFRTTESNDLLLFANIKTNLSSSFEYLIIKLVNNHLHLLIFDRSLQELYKIQTKSPLNKNHWHHLSFYRASDDHFELIIDSDEYYLLTSIYFLDKIYFGRSVDSRFLSPMPTIKACFASLTINSHSINLREYIKPNSQIRNDCFLDSQCPLKQCLNTGICRERIQCDCQHTSFQGKFCTKFKLGYWFNDSTPGLIFDQPFLKEKIFSNYQISFGIVTKMNISEIIRINDQISIELYRGLMRIRLNDNEILYNDQVINDGLYHLIQIEYNITGYLSLNVDNKGIIKELNKKILFDKPLLLLIGQNPVFKNPFQGQLYGLESDIYSIFDLISPTFQRISFAPIRNKIFSSSSIQPSIIYPPFQTLDDFIHSSCSYQPYDDICIVSSDTNSSLLSYPNVTLQSISFSQSSKNYLSSTLSYHELTFYALNSTDHYEIPPLIVSIRTPEDNHLIEKFHWQNILIFLIPVLGGIMLCLIISICCFIKYRRKDAGVYELEEAQRFRPLIVELPPSPGENTQEILNSTATLSKKTNIKSRQRRKRKRSPLIRTDDQREFYI